MSKHETMEERPGVGEYDTSKMNKDGWEDLDDEEAVDHEENFDDDDLDFEEGVPETCPECGDVVGDCDCNLNCEECGEHSFCPECDQPIEDCECEHEE